MNDVYYVHRIVVEADRNGHQLGAFWKATLHAIWKGVEVNFSGVGQGVGDAIEAATTAFRAYEKEHPLTPEG